MQILSLLVWLGICFAIAAIGRVAKPDSWYRGTNKPVWSPPDWAFAPAWTTLSALVACAVCLGWSQSAEAGVELPSPLVRAAVGHNRRLSWVFFGFHRPDFAFFEVVVFWLVILGTTVEFWDISPTAGKLMLPYIAWVAFASFFNLVLWRMNPYAVGRA